MRFSTRIAHDDGTQHSHTSCTRKKDHVDVHTCILNEDDATVSECGCVSVVVQHDGQMGSS